MKRIEEPHVEQSLIFDVLFQHNSHAGSLAHDPISRLSDRRSSKNYVFAGPVTDYQHPIFSIQVFFSHVDWGLKNIS